MTERDKPASELIADPPSELVPEVGTGGGERVRELVAEPPVVARLVVEIRSDGSRTIARGAIEDVASGQRTAIEARGDSPIQLALALARSLTRLPRLTARAAVRGLLGGRKR